MLATRYGSVPEVIRHGVTGFVVDSDDVVRAVARLDRISRAARREEAEKRLSPRAMAVAYEQVYEQLVPHRPRQRVFDLNRVDLATAERVAGQRSIRARGRHLSLQ